MEAFKRRINYRLDDVGLPQYKEAFLDAKVDGRVLNVLTVEDLISELSVTNLLHHYSIKVHEITM